MSKHNQQNQRAESRLLDHDLIEQRALQIARDEGRDVITDDDRSRARVELLAPEEPDPNGDMPPTVDKNVTAWDEAPGDSGHQVPRVVPEDETSIGKKLAEDGMRIPNRTRSGDDPLTQE